MVHTLHILGVAHTIPHEDFTVCAFTAKVLSFPEVIRPFGWYVVEYSNEGSASQAHEHIVVLEHARFAQLRKRTSRDDPHDVDVDNKELREEFQRVLLEKVAARAEPGDLVCHVWGPNIDVFNLLPNCRHVEMSVGYRASPGLPFRIFESSAWMHLHYGKNGEEDGSNYKWVIPSAFDETKWVPADRRDAYAVFLGRVTPRKGINTLVEIARRMPQLEIRAYGPGDPSPWRAEAPPNLRFLGPVFGDDRIMIIQRARCMLMPTSFIEPFGFSGIEAQLCGVPVIATSFGAFHETVIDGITGFRCHTLADWVAAIDRSDVLDRGVIAQSARARYSREVVGRQYDWAFRQLADLSGPGWYGDRSRKFDALEREHHARRDTPRTWLYVPYFGELPNYFPLYLDSLGRNQDCLTVFLITDIDLTNYHLPPNLIAVPMSLPALRSKIARLLEAEFGVEVAAETLVPRPYKLVDFKILLPELFLTLATRYGVPESDFVGWGDVDLIYGRLADFFRLEETYDVIGGYHGHLTAVRNTPSFRQIYKSVPNLLQLLLSPIQHATDEIAFRTPLLDFLKAQGAKLFLISWYVCDLVPSCFVSKFKPEVTDPDSSFFDAYRPWQELEEVRVHRDGRVVAIGKDCNEREVAYCHFQKRPMALDIDGSEPVIYARQDGFFPVPLRPLTAASGSGEHPLKAGASVA